MRQGAPKFIDYTPTTGNVVAGDVVILGNLVGVSCGIAHQDIPNNTLGSLAVGDGVYDAVNLSNLANYALAYWDNSANKLTATSTNNAVFGAVVGGGGAGANTTCQVLHNPMAPRV
jgi:predicted RecA/RadA family phage recombinase